MGATLVEKLIARHVSGQQAAPGEIVSVSVDRLMINDYVGDLIFSALEDLDCKHIVHPEKVLLAIDHNLPSFTVAAADKMVRLKEKCIEYGITHRPELGRHGISHQLMVENFVKPYETALGTDSHATMYGGLGAFSCGITTSDAIAILLTGTLWMKVPETVRIHVHGKLSQGVTPKDLSLALLNMFEPREYIYRAIEIVGDTIDEISAEGRLVIANMMAESGAKCAIFEADEKSFEYTGGERKSRITSDFDAVFAQEAEFNASALEPLLSCPDQVTNVHPLAFAEGKHVDQVFIGSCTNGRLEDLRQAAEILKGKKVAPGTRLLVTPASQQVAVEAVRTGVMEILMEAGAAVLTSSCASCAGGGPGLIGQGECCVSTTNRNFKGRMGSPDAKIYLGSAYTAAASAVTGKITDPRKFLSAKEETGWN